MRRTFYSSCFACVGSLLMFASCGERVVGTGLSDRQSVSLLVELSKRGVDGERNAEAGDSTYSVVVSSSDFTDALTVLNQKWPKPELEKQIAQLSSESSLLPGLTQRTLSKDELLLSLKIERLLGVIPGISDARALVQLPASQLNSGFGRKSQLITPRIGVVVNTTQQGAVVEQMRGRIEKLLSGIFAGGTSIPTIEILFVQESAGSDPGDLPPSVGAVWPFSFRVISSDKGLMSWQFTVLTLAFTVPSFVVGFILGSKDRAWLAGGTIMEDSRGKNG